MKIENTKFQLLILILLTLIVFFDFVGVNYGIKVLLQDLNLFLLFSVVTFYLPVVLLILGIILYVYIGKKKGVSTVNLIWVALLIFLYFIKTTANLLTLTNFKLGF